MLSLEVDYEDVNWTELIQDFSLLDIRRVEPSRCTNRKLAS
jgi:hypothetical protein